MIRLPYPTYLPQSHRRRTYRNGLPGRAHHRKQAKFVHTSCIKMILSARRNTIASMTGPNPSLDDTENAPSPGVVSPLEETGDRAICPWCKSAIMASGRGRPRVWCSDQCRRDAHTARKAARAGVVGMQVIRQTKIVEPPPPPVRASVSFETIDTAEAMAYISGSPELLARAMRVFAAGLGPRLLGRQLSEPLHTAALQLAPLLNDYARRTSPPAAESVPDTAEPAALSRQQRRALQRSTGKGHR